MKPDADVTRATNGFQRHLKPYLFAWAVPGLHCSMHDLQLRHVGSNSLTRDQTRAACIGSVGP